MERPNDECSIHPIAERDPMHSGDIGECSQLIFRIHPDLTVFSFYRFPSVCGDGPGYPIAFVLFFFLLF